MPEIKSSLTNKTMPSRPMREFTVSDETSKQGVQSRQFEGNLDIDFEQADALMKERGLPPVNRELLQSQFNQQQRTKRGLSDEEVLDFEQQIKEAKQAKLSGKERLSPGAKQRVEMLCGISRMQKEVSIDTYKCILQTLKGKEQREIWVAAAELQNTVEFPFELRKQTLARALIQIADTDIEMFLNSNLMEDKLNFIEDLPEEVLNKLYNEFNKLVDESKSKYSIKSDKEAAELVDDLKK